VGRAGMIEGSFTVTFEPPYWVGIAERHDEHGYAVARIIYGAEPDDEMILHSICAEYRTLRFSAPTAEAPLRQHELSYKRRQKEIRRLIEEEGVKHEAWEAMKAEQERHAEERKLQTKAEREAEEQRKFLLRQEKNKEKRKGH
jgi:hypothetical protein